MKLKKTILGLAVVAVAGVNAWLANDVMSAKNDLSLLNLENVADASEWANEGNINGVEIYWELVGDVILVNVIGPGYGFAGYCDHKKNSSSCLVCAGGAVIGVGAGVFRSF